MDRRQMMNEYVGDDGNPDVTQSQGSKRRARESSGSHARTKRSRYTTIACNECKRRKIKCNGKQPCQRCGNLSLECIYAPKCCSASISDSLEFQDMRAHVSSLQQQIDTLFANLRSLRQYQNISDPSQGTNYPVSDNQAISTHEGPAFSSPLQRQRKSFPPSRRTTSSGDGFDLANYTLQAVAITQESAVDETGLPSDRTATASPLDFISPHPSKDPLWSVGREEALRLCRVYEEEIGIMYPLFDIKAILEQVNMLWSFLETALKTGPGYTPGAHTIDDEDANLVKMILATALVLEGRGQSDLGQRLFESLQPAVTAKFWAPTDTKGLSLLCVAAMYFFNRGDECQSWRLIGVAARSCIEMGLHRRQSLLQLFGNEAEYLSVTKLFWVVYALDRRWSFGMAMPFALQDADIDPSLPLPDASSPYLQQLTKYNHIFSKIWYYRLSPETGADAKRDDVGVLDYQVLQWYQQLPESLRFNRNNVDGEKQVPDRGQRRLRLLLYLRANQARISVYRPMLNSTTSVLANLSSARTIVDVAKDTISVLTKIDQTTDIYRTQQVCYNYFLVQSLAVIFLAVVHAPVEFARDTRDEFYAASELVKGFSTESYISKKLWQTIRGFREAGDKIGLLTRNGHCGPDHDGEVADAHSDAAVAMAGLAGHPVDGLAISDGCTTTYASELGSSPLDGRQLTNELTKLFELAGTYTDSVGSSERKGLQLGSVGMKGEGQAVAGGLGNALAKELDFSRIIGELF